MDQTADNMSDVAKAYLNEYGSMPKSRAEQELYTAFRFGYEIGHRDGMHQERSEILIQVEGRL